MHSDPVGDVFLGVFLVGLLATVGMLLVGAGHGHAHGHGHGHAHAHAQGASGGALEAIVLLLNLSSLLGLMMAGGGAGYVGRRLGWGVGAAVAIAVIVGLVGAWLIAWVIRLLVRAEAGVVASVDLVGTVARVSAAIGAGARATGEIVFGLDGARRALPARSDDGGALERDAEVVIMRVERGVAWVRRASELFPSQSTKENG